MKVLFSTQTESLNVFYNIENYFRDKKILHESGYILSDSMHFEGFLKEYPEFNNKNILKEWELINRKNTNYDPNLLEKYEKDIGFDYGLFSAIVGDRRLFMGDNSSLTQDYKRRFSDKELLSILQSCILETEKLFNKLKPDLVIGFICVTIFDFLAYLFAKKLKIKYFNIRPTRIDNYISLCSNIIDPSYELKESYQLFINKNKQIFPKAKTYLNNIQNESLKYEGVVKPSSKPAIALNKENKNIFNIIRRIIKNTIIYNKSHIKNDNSVVNPIKSLFYNSIYNQIYAKNVNNYLKDKYIDENNIKPLNYIFFPLHTEPEISLLVYGKPYLNQIEVIRYLAISAPSNFFIIIKEHPWMVGKRKKGYYNKLLNIPKVLIAKPSLATKVLVQNSQLVATITGSTALEALFNFKPVISFGNIPYNILPDEMITQCKDLTSLHKTLRDMLQPKDKIKNMDHYLLSYISANMDISKEINLYSTLLKKRNVHAITSLSYQNEINNLADFIFKKYIRH